MAKSMYQTGRMKKGLKREYPGLVGKRMGQSVPSRKQRRIGNTVLKPNEYIKGGEKRKYSLSLDRKRISRTVRKPGWSAYRGDLEREKI